MKKTIRTAALLCTLLCGTWAAAAELTIDSKKEAAYTCTVGGKKVPMTVMYGIKDGEAVVAQAKLAGAVSPGMFRVADKLVNRFVSQDGVESMWTTLPADGSKINQVDGGILSAKQNGVQTIIAEQCKLDKAATVLLSK